MSGAWTWLVSHVSSLGGGVAILASGGALLALGVVVLAVLLVRRRSRGRVPETGQSPEVSPSVGEPAPSSPLSAPAEPTAVAPSPPNSPVPSAPRAPTRESSQFEPAPLGAESAGAHAVSAAPGGHSVWRVPSGPLAGVAPSVSGDAGAPVVPPVAVAVAERVTAPLPESMPVEPTRDTVANPAESAAEADYDSGLQCLARGDGNRAEALREALVYFRRAQEIWTREHAPERWAAVQNDIGRVYQEMPDGDRSTHLRTAIMYHQTALEVFDPVQHPLNWAWTQSALGAAYQGLPDGSAIANARAAVAYHQRALDVFTRENAPLAWAWNQNNLGAAFETMRGAAAGERVAHLRDAIRCYLAALEVYTVAEYPAQHQVIGRNLARVQAELRTLE